MMRHVVKVILLMAFILGIASAEWSEDIRLTNDLANSYLPSIAIDSEGNLHIVWIDERGPGIYYEKIDPCGKTLINDMIIANVTLIDAWTRNETYTYGRPHITVEDSD